MAIKQETSIVNVLRKRIEARGGYIPKKNHGNMITRKGLHDLPFTYRGFSCYFEAKTEVTPDDVKAAQGIHCRLARKALALTAIVWNVEQLIIILDHLDFCHINNYTPTQMLQYMQQVFKERGLDDGTKY